MEALVPRDELVGEGEAGHQAALLQPEDGAEAAGHPTSSSDGWQHVLFCFGSNSACGYFSFEQRLRLTAVFQKMYRGGLRRHCDPIGGSGPIAGTGGSEHVCARM